MSSGHGHVCPVQGACVLDNAVRRWLQNPLKILSPYIEKGMIALDIGCGPGFFTIPMAQLVGSAGRVIAVDLQEEMLEKVRRKIRKTEIERRIVLRKCDQNGIGVSERVDFVLLFYVVHEVPDKDRLFSEIARILQPAGEVLMAEPRFHVSKSAFEEILGKARAAGFTPSRGPNLFLSATAVLRKGRQ